MSVPPVFRYGERRNSPRAMPLSPGECAGVRLFSYAGVQKEVREATRAHCEAAAVAHLFHPRISDMAQSTTLRRAPLYPGKPSPLRTTSSSTSSPEAAQQTSHAAPMSPQRWSEFLARSAAHEAHRSRRLRQLKLEMAERELQECTFRPSLVPQLVKAEDTQVTPSTSTRTSAGRGPSDGSLAEVVEGLVIFEEAMDALQKELLELSQQKQR